MGYNGNGGIDKEQIATTDSAVYLSKYANPVKMHPQNLSWMQFAHHISASWGP